MNQLKKPYRLIVSGGGTGGHLFPAISIADKVKELEPLSEILFVGALGRMEMERVPLAGYRIEGLPIMGIPRKISFGMVQFFFRWMQSLVLARKIIRRFSPDAVVGVGGYASAPVLQMAVRMGVPAMIQEQNSYAGVANRSVARKAGVICVAYPGMEKYFPAEKVVLTGNPVRKGLEEVNAKRAEALGFFKLDPQKKTILVTGGSLGARTLNNSVLHSLDRIGSRPVQLIWQCGKNYFSQAANSMESYNGGNIQLLPFLERMDLAYAAADLIISRAGAGTISELCIVGKPVILVPSPNVAEDHQTKNARSLTERKAALMVADGEAEEHLFEQAFRVLDNSELTAQLSSSIKALAIPDASQRIAEELFNLIEMTNAH